MRLLAFELLREVGRALEGETPIEELLLSLSFSLFLSVYLFLAGSRQWVLVDGDFLEIAPEAISGEDKLLGGVVQRLQGLCDLDVVLLVAILVAVLAFGDGRGGCPLALGKGGVFGRDVSGALLGLHCDLTDIYCY